jgi:hypothetical protein
MLSLIFVCVIESGVFFKMTVNLLDLWNFPTVVLLGLRKAVRLGTCLYLSFTLECDFPRVAIKLFSDSLPRFLIMIPCLVTVVLFPSFSLGSRQNLWRLLCKDTTLIAITICQIVDE